MKLWKPSKMKVKALQFTKKSLISRKWVFLMEEGQFHGKFFGCEIVNYVCPYKYSEKFGGYLFLKHPVHVSMLLWIEVTNIAYCVILVDITLLWMGRVFWPICSASGQPQSTLLCFNTTGTTVLSTVVPGFLKESLSNEGHTIPVRW